MIVDMSTILTTAGSVTVLGGAFATIQKVLNTFKKKRSAYREAILYQAKEDMSLVKQGLELKIENLEEELKDQKESVSKDLGYMKESYSEKIENLSNKIDELKKDLSDSHNNLVLLITRIVDNK